MNDLIQMRGGEKVDARELRILEPGWKVIGERLDALAVDEQEATS